ncbi:bifunctional (p)ppGpp synthetase/guanosine-3',5'-bis(diphosphate) 3'-pyrophosphohydrolase [Candidatus Micrarchaeota archaeon]|nr:bifunctional (p)ppGpp synthetase/guanosine-3',5'-bis(diphosphate) 3'-pyrophosphohydrolase [Candidatus Micrarchaeota archaeon]
MIAKAFEFAFNAHGNQKRKGTDIPYIIHPMEVAVILMKNGAPDYLVVAGLLHDVVEDTDIELSEIANNFGKRVALLVKSATEPQKLDKKVLLDEKKTWKERKMHTIASMKNSGREIKMLSCADKLSNIRSMIEDYRVLGERLWKKFNAPKKQQRWYYRSMLKTFSHKKNSIVDLQMYKDFKECVEQFFGEK